jgi:hypothetical protein
MLHFCAFLCYRYLLVTQYLVTTTLQTLISYIYAGIYQVYFFFSNNTMRRKKNYIFEIERVLTLFYLCKRTIYLLEPAKKKVQFQCNSMNIIGLFGTVSK